MRTDLSFDQCEDVLKNGFYGHLGYISDGEPFVVPVTFAYKYGYLYSYTFEGHKVSAMRIQPKICLQVEHVKSGYEWESVICWGIFEEVTDPAETHEIEMLLADQYAKISMQEKTPPVMPMINELNHPPKSTDKKPVVYRINIQKTTGKAEKRAAK